MNPVEKIRPVRLTVLGGTAANTIENISGPGVKIYYGRR
jgi:hypothetical protein